MYYQVIFKGKIVWDLSSLDTSKVMYNYEIRIDIFELLLDIR